MNASPPLFPFDATAKPASFPTGPGPGSGDNAFAEQLSEALAASTLTTASPMHHQAALPDVRPGIDGIGRLQPAGELPGETTGELPVTDLPALLDDGSITPDAMSEAAADAAGSGEAGSAERSTEATRRGGQGLIRGAPADVMPVASKIGEAGSEITPKASPAPAVSAQPTDIPETVSAARPAATIDGLRPTEATSSDNVGEVSTGRSVSPQEIAPVTEPGRHRPVAAVPVVDTAGPQTATGSAVAFEGPRPNQAEPSSTDPVSRRDGGSAAYPADRPSPSILADRIEPALPNDVATSADIERVRPTTISERALQPPLSSQGTVTPAGPHLLGDHGQATAGRLDIISTAKRHLGDRRSETAAATSITPLIAQETRSAAVHDPAPVSALAEGRLSGSPPASPIGNGDHPLAQAVGDVAATQATMPDGGERLQPVSALEGLVRDVERLDPTTGAAASTRPQAQAAHPAPGTQVALQIVRALPEGGDRLSVHLQPADLGSVDIQLTFDGAGRLSALIAAERPETLELLQRDSRLLERSLGDSGLKLTNDGLSFALKQDQQQQQPGQNFQQQAEAREQASRASRAYDDATDVEQAPPVRRIDGLRLLDIET